MGMFAQASINDAATVLPVATTRANANAKTAGKAAPKPLQEAKNRLDSARDELATTKKLSRQMRYQANNSKANSRTARRDLGNIARGVYANGSVELLGFASVFDAKNPSEAIRRAAVAQQVVDHQTQEWKQSVKALNNVTKIREQARTLLRGATVQYDAALATVRSIKNRDVFAEIATGGGGQNGSQGLAAKCARAQVVVSLCAKPRWTENNLTLDAVIVSRTVNVKWPQIREVGGWRPYDAFPDHPSGRATDIMMPDSGSTPADVKLGNEIAQYFQAHAAEYGLYYMIWRQRMWKATDPIGQWTSMGDRGSPTANHMDHVHVSLTNGHSGTAFAEALGEAATQ